MLKKFFWFLLFLAVVVLAAAVAGLGIAFLDWPPWLGGAVGAGIIACFFFTLFLKKYLVRRRGKKLVEQIVDQEQIIDEDAAPDSLQVKELEKSWHANLALLRDSHLRSRGNPVYVLPWYLAIGAAGTGKTTAISNFGLAASVAGTEQDGQAAATRNCDWWFLNRAVVLDAAGRYALPVEGTGDQDEWKRFLTLLAKHRKREPLNGILLFISADLIREAAGDLLKKQGQLLRNRVDNLMRTIGYKIPVRVIITKMDLVPGFIGFADSIDSSDHDQVMGYWNRKGTPFWQEVLDDVMRETGERLREIRREYVLAGRSYQPDFLVFPESFDQLRSGLSSFLEPVFSENRFQETPYLAGIYFGSGRAPLSASPDREIKLAGSGRPFFLTELFSRILADGRERLEPVKEFVLWRRMTRSFGLMSWWLFCLFWAGLVGISFINNQNSLSSAKEITETTYFPSEVPTDQKEFNADVLELEKLRREIIKLEDLNRSNRLSNIHFGHAVNTEQELKKRYCDSFESVLQQPLESRLAHSISRVNEHTSNELFADYADFGVEYIYLLQKYLAEEAIEEISSGFSPAAARILHFPDGTISSEVAGSFADLNKHYLFWTEDRNTAASRLKILQADLVKLLAHRTDDVSWLYHPLITETEAIGLGDFWSHKILQQYNIFFVDGAFTGEGRSNIHAFFKMTAEAMKRRPVAGSLSTKDAVEQSSKTEWVGEKVLEALRQRFRQSYETVFFARWYNFAENFSVARNSLVEEEIFAAKEDNSPHLQTESVSSDQDDTEIDLSPSLPRYHGEKWREAAIRMTKASNPYFTLIEKMAEEVESFAADEDFLQYEENGKKVNPPPWAEAVIAFEEIRQQADTIRKTEGKGLSATAAKVTSRFSKIKSKLGLNKAERIATKTGIGKKQANYAGSKDNLAAAWNEYRKALNALEAATPYKEKTFQVVSNWFREAVNPGDDVSLYGKAYKTAGILHGLAKGKYENSFAWRLVEGPFDFLTEFGLKESAAVFQDQWMEQVVAPSEAVLNEHKRVGFLFEKENGAVWKFVKGSGGPFLQNTVHGYQSRSAFGRSLLLEPALYAFLDQGNSVVINRQADYRVEITNRPMEVNRDATEEPSSSVITVQCAEDEIVLENDNYPRTQIFTWSPDKCSDVNLTIDFPGATLRKHYGGHMAFAHFLNDFIDGALRFTPEDFPDEAGHLKSTNIKNIVLTYSVSGQEEVLRLLELKPVVPRIIALPEQQHGDVIFN
ncbi:MAG: type VI secretion protein IcmF/TssM N-terminal domain-containing protein [Candidatus Electrothrix sp. YB6]